MALPDADFAAEAERGHRPVVARARPEPSPDSSTRWLRAALGQASIKTKADVARVYGDLIRRVYEDSKKRSARLRLRPTDSRRRDSADPGDRDQPRQPGLFPQEPDLLLHVARRERRIRRQADGTRPDGGQGRRHAAPRAMVLERRRPSRTSPRVFVRGNPSQPGDRVPRQFLRVLAGDASRARSRTAAAGSTWPMAITAADNPLTSRVIVNRVWMHHFGEPLVSTPSDFGTRSSPPSHPELLDDLAARFMQAGWSLKTPAPADHALQHISAGELRPARLPQGRPREPPALAVPSPPARPGSHARHPAVRLGPARPEDERHGPWTSRTTRRPRRRTVYGLVDRQSLPAVFRAFDFASPDLSSERRPRTTVPQQALFSMNAPLVIEQARALAARPEIAARIAPEAKVQRPLSPGPRPAARPGRIRGRPHGS